MKRADGFIRTVQTSSDPGLYRYRRKLEFIERMKNKKQRGRVEKRQRGGFDSRFKSGIRDLREHIEAKEKERRSCRQKGGTTFTSQRDLLQQRSQPGAQIRDLHRQVQKGGLFTKEKRKKKNKKRF